MEQPPKIEEELSLLSQREKEESTKRPHESKEDLSDSSDLDNKQGSWSLEDINLLLEKNNQFGRQWRKIALDFKGKSARQCAYMYDKITASGTYGKFNRVDDLFLLDLVKLHGYNWPLIQSKLPKFSIIQIKNRYNKVLLSQIDNKEMKRRISTFKLIHNSSIEKESTSDIKQSSTQSEYPIHTDEVYTSSLNEGVQTPEEAKCNYSANIEQELSAQITLQFNKLKVILSIILQENKRNEEKYQSQELQQFNVLLIKKMKRLLLLSLNASKLSRSASGNVRNMLKLIRSQLLLIQLGKLNSKLYIRINRLMQALDTSLNRSK